MKVPAKLCRSDSKKTLKSIWMNGEQLNDSVDMDSEEDTSVTTKDKNSINAYQFKSRFDDRPSTIFFHYPKCCAI